MAPAQQQSATVVHPVHECTVRRRRSPMAREAVSTADDTSPLHGVSRRLAERQVRTSPWCLACRPVGYTMARLAHEDRLGCATVALCLEGCATTAHVDVDCTTVVPCH